MQRWKLPAAILFLFAAIAFAVYFITSNPWAQPHNASNGKGPPSVPGHGPTPEQLKQWSEGIKKREAEKHSEENSQGPPKGQSTKPVPEKKGGE